MNFTQIEKIISNQKPVLPQNVGEQIMKFVLHLSSVLNYEGIDRKFEFTNAFLYLCEFAKFHDLQIRVSSPLKSDTVNKDNLADVILSMARNAELIRVAIGNKATTFAGILVSHLFVDMLYISEHFDIDINI